MEGIKDKKIGFIGSGQMAEAIFSGLIKKEVVLPSNMLVCDVRQERLTQLKEQYGLVGILNSENNKGARELIEQSDIVFLAVKPQYLNGLLEGIEGTFGKGQLVISIVGGATLDTLEKAMPGAAVIRVMPNTPMLVGEGVSGIALGKKATSEDGQMATTLFSAVSRTYSIDENMINPFSGVCGSGPAYAYVFLEALADGGVETGLPRDIAYQLAARTLIGAGRMLLETGQTPSKLKDDVCSPGGGTIRGIHALEEAGFRGAVMEAVRRGKERMDEIGKQMKNG